MQPDGAEPHAPAVSPWLALWFHPRAAIDAVLATYGSAIALAITLFVAPLQIAAAFPQLTADLRLAPSTYAPVFVLFGPVVLALAFVGFFVNGLFLNGAAKLIGGKGSVAATRAAHAWGSVPLGVGSAVALLASSFIPTASDPIYLTACLWSLVLQIAMLARVQMFGRFRATIGLSLGTLAPSILVILLIRSLLFQPFSVPSGSMIPALMVGDYFFASKFDYGFGRYSFPLSLATFQGRLLARPPHRGDVAVFRRQGQDFVKRVIGLPGESIQLKAGRLYIDGQIVERRPGPPDFRLLDTGGKLRTAQAYWEVLPSIAPYRIIQLAGDGAPASNTPVYKVPAGKYFLLGDNRDNSEDSRFDSFGYVGFDDLVGRAAFIYYSRAPDPNAPVQPQPGRIGTWVR